MEQRGDIMTTANCVYPKCNKPAKRYMKDEIAICNEHLDLADFIDAVISAKTRATMK
jgi:hypothetical protein